MGNFLICVFQNPLFSKMQISGLIQNGLCIICIKNCIFRNVELLMDQHSLNNMNDMR